MKFIDFFLSRARIAALPALYLVMTSGALAADRPDPANLLPGDPSFETGFNGWHAYTSPWINTELANDYYQSRFRNDHLADIDHSTSRHGNNSARLQTLPDHRSYLTTTQALTLDGGRYSFTASIKCDADTTVQMRLIPMKNIRGWKFYASIDNKKFSVGKEWQKIKLEFYADRDKPFIPGIDLMTANRTCNIDSLGLYEASRTEHGYTPPSPLISSLIATSDIPTAMPSLYLAERGKSVEVTFTVSLLDSAGHDGYSIRVYTQEPQSTRKLAKQIDNISTEKDSVGLHKFTLAFRDTGIWKIHADITGDGKTESSSTTVLATMVPADSTTRPDRFFGSHQKIGPLTRLMGFGSIRDMHLLEWQSIQPEKDKWTLPEPDEIETIEAFIDSGGSYLATLVAESPRKTSWAKKTWGKRSYGKIPLWAGGKRDTSGGQSKHVTRRIKDDAMRAYVAGIVQRYPFLELEVMNEPNHYMDPEEYFIVLKAAYEAAKKLSPETTIAAFANPPVWPYLKGGHKGGRTGKPYEWFNEAFELGSADYLDVITLHTYDRSNRDKAPETGYGGGGQADWASGLKQLAEKYKGGEAVPVWVSEKGVASPSWRAERKLEGRSTKRVSDALKQAAWIVRSQIDMKAKGIERFYLWNTPWGTAGNQRFYPLEDTNFTLYDADGLPRPALIAQKVLIEQLSHTTPVRDGTLGGDTRYAVFKTEQSDDGNYIFVIWTVADSTESIICPGFPAGSVYQQSFGKKGEYSCEDRLDVGQVPVYYRFEMSAADPDDIIGQYR